MWKNPKTILDVFCPALTALCLRGDLGNKLSLLRHDGPWAEAYRVITDLYRQALTQTARADIERVLRRELLKIAKQIEQSKNWQLIADLGRATQAAHDQGSDSTFAPFATFVTQLLHYLVGSEKELLIGTRFGQATWTQWTPPKTLQGAIDGRTVAVSIGPDIEYICSADLEMLSGVGAWKAASAERIQSLPRVPKCWQLIADLLESAYYNQQYVPHPAGSFVQLKGVAGVDSVMIKAKRGLNDRNYVDLVGLFSFGEEKQLVVVDGDAVMQNEDNLLRQIASRRADLLVYLTALIYHDLVTAKEVSGPRSPKSAVTVTQRGELKNVEPSWIYIPRVHRKTTLDVRQPAAHPRSMRPHRVSGHKRRGNLTEEHRTVLRSFEEESGIEILRWLPEGYTFVRPHISPVDDSQVIQGLPRFIRRRIQDDIRKLLSN